MPVSKAQQKAVAKYMKTNYDEIKLRIPKGRKSTVEAFAKEHEESVNGYINRLIRGDIGLTEDEWKHSEE